MGPEQVVQLGRSAMETALWVAAPILLVMTAVSILISVAQVITSTQDPTLATIPRLAAAGTTVFMMMHWILRHLVGYTVQLFSDLHPFVR